jgi:hypothetical protein
METFNNKWTDGEHKSNVENMLAMIRAFCAKYRVIPSDVAIFVADMDNTIIHVRSTHGVHVWTSCASDDDTARFWNSAETEYVDVPLVFFE